MILTMQKVYVRAYSGRFSPAKQMFEKACKFVLCMIEYHKRTHEQDADTGGDEYTGETKDFVGCR